ncbi:MarR family transcriptional regulator [Streptomyces sp. 3MP-14]|uniref:MarR family transcriptional regulator n=1 Tax=Streptomyces mimosae TaxID=2586635 RepID=A0A5N6AT90_9ACTN|nr:MULTISPECIES: MarR family winged helix-turn-helix transcriptional regulator [Streptomyces]KAB8170939.1 MarR family transcriptional regulator [Streptomyces mimosae]KAB8179710.1 MarR family transcriptional regulator [Streptomyces sp. 3MP-14]
MSAPPARLHDDLHWVFARLKQALASAQAPVLARHGLSHWGYTVLLAVAESPAGSQLALARAVSVDKSKLVQILDELERAGLLARRPDPADRRARIVTVTEEGTRVLAAARAEVAAVERRLLAGCEPGAAEALRATLRELAGAPAAGLDGGDPGATSCVEPGHGG